MRAKEILTENTLDAAKIADIAQHMLNRYRGLRYTAGERAVDHAFGYDRNQPQHQYWLAVADEISRLEKNDKDVAEGVNDYLWHGSKSKHEILYPQQANDTGGKEESNKNAVYATPSAKVAIAMGLTTPGSDTGMFPNDPQMVLFSGNIRKGQMVYLHKVPKNLFIKHHDREWYSKPGVKEVKPIEIKAVPVDQWLHLIRQATPQDLELQKKYMKKAVKEVVHPDIFDKHISKEPTEKVRMGDFEFDAHPFKGRIRGYGNLNDIGLYVTAYDRQNVIGWAHFVVKSDEKGNQWLESADTQVDDDYWGRGVAAMMYAFAKSLGNDVKPSPDQSNFGKRMWKKWGKDANHLVGEQGVAEGKVKLYTDPDYFGAEVDDTGFDSLPVVNIPLNQLVGFEPDSKMRLPKAQANVKKILAGLEQGDNIPPILVRKHKTGYQVLDGHHRFWAYKVSKKNAIPARVVDPKDIEEVGKQGVAEDTVNEFAISGDDDSGPQRPMSLEDIAKIIRAKLGPGWTMEHVGRTEQPAYKFIPTDKTKHGMAKIWCLVDWDKAGEYPTYNTILYSFQNENGRLIANGRHTEKAKPKTVSNALMTAQSILGNTDGALKNSMAEDTVDEMALASYKTLGDFDKPGSFRGVDKRLVPHPKSEIKAAKFFEQTPYDFRLFFANKPGLGQYQEHGPMTPEEIVKVFGEEDAKTILDNHDDTITVVYVSNRGDEKVMMTPWIMAHRFGHAIQAGARRDKWSAWRETEKIFFSTVNRLLDEYYGKVGSVFDFRKADQPNYNLTPEYNALFNAIGTQKSSRSGQIRRPYEFMYELFAQYLGTGTITLNPLPTNLGYGRKVFGNPSKYLNIKTEFLDETERRQVSEMLARDMELMFNDVLGNSVGKVYIM